LHEGLKAWEVALARVTHALFYLLMLGMPLSGWLMHSAFSGGKPVGYFGLFNLPGIPMAVNKPLGGVFHEMHELGGYAMLALFALHVAGALKHQFLDRHPGAIARILPGRS
jgi:cytochrome b561